MKKSYLFALFALMIIAIACGGGGGGGGGNGQTDGSSSGSFNVIRAEASNAADTTHQIDAQNITVGQTIQFEVVGYDNSNVRHVLTSSNWTTTDNGNTVGSLGSDGLFSATASSGSTFTASGISGGITYNINYSVKPIQATATASVLDDNGLPAGGVKVLFFNSGGVQVGAATSANDGSLSASVPTTAVTFTLDATTLPSSKYFKSFKLHGFRYTTLEASCKAPMPALTNGVSTNVGAIIIDATVTGGILNPPPPPPDGCS